MDTKYRIMAMTLVDRLIDVGAPIYVLAVDQFVVTNSDVADITNTRIDAILADFAPLDPLRPYIVAYLRELGRDLALSTLTTRRKTGSSSIH